MGKTSFNWTTFHDLSDGKNDVPMDYQNRNSKDFFYKQKENLSKDTFGSRMSGGSLE